MNLTRIGMAAALALTCFVSTAHAQNAAPVGAGPAAQPGAPAVESPAAPASPASPASPAASNAAGAAATTEQPAGTSHRTLWPWVIMGAGVGLVVTAIVVEVHAVRQDDKRQADETQLFSLPAGDPSRASLQASAASHDDAAKSSRTTALIIGSVGFVAMAGAVVLWFFEGSSGDASTSAANASLGPARAAKKTLLQKPSFVPSFAPGYAGASFGTTF